MLSPSPFPFTGRGIEPQGGGGSARPTPTSPGPQQGFGDHPGTHGSQSTPAANRTPSAPHPSPAVPVTCRLTQNKDVGAASLTMTPGRRRPQRPRGAAPRSAGSRGPRQVCGALQGALHALLFWKATCSALCTVTVYGGKKKCRQVSCECVHPDSIPRGPRPFTLTAYLPCSARTVNRPFQEGEPGQGGPLP